MQFQASLVHIILVYVRFRRNRTEQRRETPIRH